jgi:hypothetical protein
MRIVSAEFFLPTIAMKVNLIMTNLTPNLFIQDIDIAAYFWPAAIGQGHLQLMMCQKRKLIITEELP